MSWIQPNLAPKGRAARAAAALVFGTGGIFLWPISKVGGGLLLCSAIFLALEAVRGWCALRACGIKTRW